MLEKIRSKLPPVALNTVDMLRVASSQLHMGPHHVMHLAEKLYTQVWYGVILLINVMISI